MQTLPCPRCGQPRTAHAACPACGAPGLETDVPPLQDVPTLEAVAVAEAAVLPAPEVAEDALVRAAPGSIPYGAGPFAPAVPVAPRRQGSELLGRVGYLLAALLATGALFAFHAAVWGGHDDEPVRVEETMPTPPEAPSVPDVPRPPGMSDGEWEEMQRALREAQRDVQEAVREADDAAREAAQAAEEAAREAEAAAREEARRVDSR